MLKKRITKLYVCTLKIIELGTFVEFIAFKFKKYGKT